MKKFAKLFTVFLLLALILLPTTSAQAKGSLGGKIIFGQNFTLEKGQTMDGDLVVFGGNITIEEGAKVTGSIVIFGGNLIQDGQVAGDMVMFGGNASVGEKGLIEGDAVTIGGQLDVAEGGEIKGDRVTNVPMPEVKIPATPVIPTVPPVPNIPKVPETPAVPSVPHIDITNNPLFQAMNVIFRAVAVAALAMLLTLFLQPQLDRVSQAIVQQPWMAGGMGLLTVVVAPLALLLMVITLILIPVAALVALLLPLAWLFGIIAIGQEVGERFTKAITQTWAPVLTTGFGTFLLMLVGGFIGMLPCIGWLAPFLIGMVAIGGVVMTWFGTRQASGPRMNVPAEPLPPAS